MFGVLVLTSTKSNTDFAFVDAREVCVLKNCCNESRRRAGDQTSYGPGKVLVRVQCSTECTASKNPEASTQSRRGYDALSVLKQ